MIIARELSKQFQKRKVLQQISFEVERGEIFVLLGRNGAGKSTTLHLLTGIHHPDSGHVEILGKSGSELRKILPKIGVLTENQNYFDDLSPLEHLQFFSKLKGIDDEEENLRKLLKRFHLETNTNKKVKHFSQGLKKRLGIAQAFLHNPKCLFFDEPTADLDPESVQSFYEELRKRADQGVAIFLTTFQADVAEKIATKVALLENAKIKKMGKLPDLYNQGKKQKLLKIRLSPLTNEEEKAIRQLFLLHGAVRFALQNRIGKSKGLARSRFHIS
jgi:ABC-2 type transport system ATP-binding protein